MNKLKRLLFGIALAVVMIATSACSKATLQGAELNDLLTLLPQSEKINSSFSSDQLEGFKGIVESKYLKLFLNEETAEVAVLDKRNNYIWRSNPEHRDSDPLAAGVNKDMLAAQIRIYYYNMIGQVSTMNSKSDSLNHQQVAYENIDKGVRVTYQFGTIQKGPENLPAILTPERYEELTSQMDDNGKRALRATYNQNKKTGNYERLDSSLRGLQLQRALEAFASIGYTEEDLARDNAEHGITVELQAAKIFGLSIEYTLDDDSLLVRVPTDRVKFPSNYPINRIELLTFFGAGGPDEEGALVIPDGSGALIYFNNGKSKYPSYQQDVYGRDITMDTTEFLTRDQSVRLPVFGIYRKNAGVIGIIEQGASVATISADVSGRLNSYNYVYPTFYFVNKMDITLNAGAQQRSLPKFQVEPMKTDYVVRYAFLTGDNASYVGMANYYRDYLKAQNMLPELKDTDENIPFYLQLFGSIERQKHILGVPYRAQEALTTFEQAKQILSELKERNIEDIKVKLTGWFNGGVNQKTPDKVKVNGSLGGSKKLKDLLAFGEAEGIEIFPDVGILEVKNTKGFKVSKEAARKLTEDPAAIYPIDMAMNRRDRSRSPSFVLAPRLVSEMVDSMLKDLKKLDLHSISLNDLAHLLNSDYRKNNLLDRTESEKISIEALKTIRDSGYTIMADGGNAYALPYLTDITNAPMSNSNFKLEDESIPFYQIVLRGHVQYTGEPYNLSVFTNPRQYLLKVLEYGSGLHFGWIYGSNSLVKDTEFDYLYAVHYKEWIDLAENLYHEANNVLKNVHGQPIIGHEKLADGVYKTVYGNGFYVIVNYNLTSVTVDGQTIGAESFITGGERS